MKKTHRATGLEPNIGDGAPQVKQDQKEHDRTGEHRPLAEAGWGCAGHTAGSGSYSEVGGGMNPADAVRLGSSPEHPADVGGFL